MEALCGRTAWRVLIGMAVAAAPATALAIRPMIAGGNPSAQPGSVNLPYLISQSGGAQWNIFPGGWLQQQGNMPVYGQGALLLINGQQVGQNGPGARLDGRSGELVIENPNVNGLAITRHILAGKDDGYVRYIDVIKNTQNAEQAITLMVQSNLNFGVQNAQVVADPKKKDRQLGWVAQTGAGASAVEVFNGQKCKTPLVVTVPPGSNIVQATVSITLPAGREVAVMHLHSTAQTVEAANAIISKLDEHRLIKAIPLALRKLIINFNTAQDMLADMELLRGELLDVVELRSGDQIRGTLKQATFDVTTSYGLVSVPMDKVVSLFSSGQFRPRELVVTSDGQVIGGTLKNQTIDLQLSSGQVTQIPIGQVSRLGYRKRPNESDEWNFEGKSLVMMRSGDRVSTQMPTQAVSFITRFGKLTLKPEQVNEIILQQEDQPGHLVILTDGSRFSGLLEADQFDFKLGAGDQMAQFPVSGISRLQFAGRVTESDDFTPTIKLGDDVLVGSAVGQLKLDTAFDQIVVNATEIRSMTHVGKGVADVQLTLWDGTTLSGELEDRALSCHLQSGVDVQIPVGLIDAYSQPQPQPAPGMLAKIKAIIVQLNNDNWRQRDHATSELMGLGPVAITTLRQLRVDQPLEAQKNIDLVLKDLEKQRQQQSSPQGSAPKADPAQGDDVLNKDN